MYCIIRFRSDYIYSLLLHNCSYKVVLMSYTYSYSGILDIYKYKIFTNNMYLNI